MWVVGFMSFGFTEILVIGTVALLVFGGDLPDVMRNLGKAYGKFRQGLQEMSKPVREEVRRMRDEVPNVAESVSTSASPPVSTPATPAPTDPEPYDVGTPTDTSTVSDDAWDDLDEPPPV